MAFWTPHRPFPWITFESSWKRRMISKSWNQNLKRHLQLSVPIVGERSSIAIQYCRFKWFPWTQGKGLDQTRQIPSVKIPLKRYRIFAPCPLEKQAFLSAKCQRTVWSGSVTPQLLQYLQPYPPSHWRFSHSGGIFLLNASKQNPYNKILHRASWTMDWDRPCQVDTILKVMRLIVFLWPWHANC